ncbi:hypothetical protein [Xenorhabdus lircayensis]|uniref:Uncharacterized protein n=1 Tax=Xenorhabdus lircayensis TaxID=2763499 RepID=A0ABS0UAW1_9GAMM|nr:hypothetical protein [Xenorhabdus lircayensis]MBI6549906.1 hypothetical protein [Xenorhabdus lircayensis]
MPDITKALVLGVYGVTCFLVFLGLAIKFRNKRSGRKLNLFENIFVSWIWPALVLLAIVDYLDSMYDKFTRRKSE